eukprot:superscaffoldBa00001972_g12710
MPYMRIQSQSVVEERLAAFSKTANKKEPRKERDPPMASAGACEVEEEGQRLGAASFTASEGVLPEARDYTNMNVSPGQAPHDARLVGGDSRCSGRLEMKHHEEWRTLNVKDKRAEAMTKVRYAQVACMQMGCGSVVSITNNNNNTNQEPAWEVNFSCRGTESTLRECNDSTTRRRVQGKNMTASSLEVICSESVRLVGGSRVCSGSVEVKSDQGWAPVCEDGFDSEAEKVVCREFGCGPPVLIRTSKLAVTTLLSGPSQLLMVPPGSSSLLQRMHTEGPTKLHDVRLVDGFSRCAGRLEVKHQKEWRPSDDQEVQLIIGYSFTINCSTQPQYPGGHFSLIFNSLNQTHSQTQPAVNHSALFTFTAAEESQGNYSCVYHNFIFNHNYSSQSQSLSITVTDFIDVMLDDGVIREDYSSPCAGKLLVNYKGELRLLSAESTVWDLKHASMANRGHQARNEDVKQEC